MSKILIRGGRVVTMNEKQEILERADILVDGGTIASVAAAGDENEETANVEVDTVIDAEGKVVMPGFVQTHIHLCQTLFRGQADDLELMDWLRLRIWPLEGGHDEESIYWSAMLGITELIKGGTTAIIDMETVHHTESAFQAINTSGIRATSGKVMMDHGGEVPPTLMESTEDSLKESEELLRKWHMLDGGRIRYAFAPRFVVSCTDDLLVRVVAMAKDYGVLVHTHASENRGEIELVMAEKGMRNVEFLRELGLLGPNLVLAHCIWLDEDEMEMLRLRDQGCPLPVIEPKLFGTEDSGDDGWGVFVSLGDGAPCNKNLDAFMEMRLAALTISSWADCNAGNKVLEMATKGGAEAMGMKDEIGSIEPGKRADIIILDIDHAHAAPTENVNLISRIVYEAKAADVETTIVDGRILMHERKLTSIDEEEVIREANKALERVLRRAGVSPSSKK